jgi:hypothetical protein
MRPASCRVALWISVCSLLASFFVGQGLAYGQTTSASKRKLSRQVPAQQSAAANIAPTPKGVRPQVTTETWTGGGGSSNTNWSDASNWNNGAITSGENIVISTTNAATVDDFNVSIGNLTLSNAGDSVTTTGATLTVDGTITNNGSINLSATAYGSEGVLYIGGNSTLTGTGAVVLGNGGTNFISGTSGAILTNDSTIEGGWSTSGGYAGVGQGQIALANNGIINANLNGGILNLDPTGSVGSTNTGTLEATNGGTLQMQGGTWTQTGSGTISAANGSTVALQNGVSITGGVLSTSGSGLFAQNNGGTVSLSNLTLNGTYDIEIAGGSTDISGTITNKGTINLLANSYGAQGILYLTANTTLTGPGVVVLGNETTQNFISGNSGLILTNASTIEGGVSNSDGFAGIGNGQIALANSGTINANVAGGGLLYVNPTSSVTSTNTGTLEATNGGTLVLDGGTWTQTGAGTISAGTGSVIDLESGVSITGGKLTSTGTGLLQQNDGGTVYLTNVANSGTYDIQLPGGVTEISGTITNTGTINLLANAYGAQGILYVAANTKLTGKGAVVLGNETTQNFISGASGVTLTNASTIEGGVSNSDGFAGIGNGILKLVNSGTIDANVSGGLLYVNPLTTATNTNSKTLEATNGGILVLDGSKWSQTATGTITAATGSTVVLQDGVSITGGTLTTAGTGVIDTAIGQTVYLSNLTNAGTFDVLDSATATISGTITNNGTINLNSTGDGTYLYLSGNTTLAGTGAVVMGSGGPNIINGVGGAILTNESTIEGTGNIGNGNLTITNQGTFDANVTGENLVIAPGSGGFTNYNGTTNTLTGGTYIANGGNLTFAGSATGITTLSANVIEENGGQFIDTNGNINALANLTSITSTGSLTTDVNFTDPGAFSNAGSLTILKGTTFTVQSLSQISGSTLTAGTYVLDANLSLSGATQSITTNAANLTLAGGTIENANNTNALAALATNSGSLTLANAATFTTKSNFSNTGTLTVDKGSTFTVNGTLAQISGSTLASGTFVLGGNLTVGSGVSITTNATSLTLEGGTIESGTSNALANLASNTGNLTLANSGSFTTGASKFTNSGALTINSGSTFTVTNALGNLSSGTLSGGTYTIGGTLQMASSNGGIVTNAANLTLTGKTAKILDGTANALAGFANNTGSLTLAGDAALTTAASNFSNSGTVDVATGSTLTIGGTTNSYNQTAGKITVDGTLTGAVNLTGGTIQGAGTLKGNVSVGGTGTTPTLHVGDSGMAGLLKITGTYTQLSTGTLNVAIGGLTSGTQYSKLTISGAASLSGNLTVNMINGFVPAVGKTFTILSAKSITGTFSTQYIVINSSEYFAVTYTATGVVLKVDSGTPPTGSDTSHSAVVVAVVKKDDKTTVLTSDLRKRYSGEPSRLLTASAHAPRGTLAQRYPLENNLAYRFENSLDNRLDTNVRPPNGVYALAIWRGPAARPVAHPSAPVAIFHSPSLHPANGWTPSNGVANPPVNHWQNNQGRTIPALRTMPSLMRAR